jgi:Ca2+-binding EF-hand superfamily protein
MSISEQQIKEVFSKFDTDGSGEISISELLNLLRQLYAGKSDNDIKAIAHVSHGFSFPPPPLSLSLSFKP